MTLTQTAIIVKQLIFFSILSLILGVSSFIGFRVWDGYRISQIPPVEEKPDINFGILPYPQFPQTDVSSSNFTYSLDTVTGNLPKLGEDPGFDKIIKVYFIPKLYATLLSSERSSEMAEKFGIFTQPIILNEVTYRYEVDDKSLVVDIDSGNFTYSLESSPSASQKIDTDDKLTSDFKNQLASLGLLKEQLKKGVVNIIPMKIDGDRIVKNDSENDAEFAQISISPEPIDGRQIYTKDFNIGPVSAIVSEKANNINNYYSLKFSFWPVDVTSFATYPAKSLEKAFDDLKTGNAVVILAPENPAVSITSISVGYFMQDSYTRYLQPIYIFEGPHFVAYVPAISSESLDLPK